RIVDLTSPNDQWSLNISNEFDCRRKTMEKSFRNLVATALGMLGVGCGNSDSGAKPPDTVVVPADDAGTRIPMLPPVSQLDAGDGLASGDGGPQSGPSAGAVVIFHRVTYPAPNYLPIYDLYAVNTDSSAETNLSTSNMSDTEPAISPA